MKPLLLFLCLFALAVDISAGVYKWVDDEGNVHFSDEKPEDQQVEEKNYSVGEPEEAVKTIKLLDPSKKRSQKPSMPERASLLQQPEVVDEKQLQKRHCNQLKSTLIMDKSLSRVYVRKPDGGRRVLTEGEREQRRKDLQLKLQQECSDYLE